MPELPELHCMAEVINTHAAGRTFISCRKSSINKLPPVKVPKGSFTMSAQSRGKELMMTLQPASPLDGGGKHLEGDARRAVFILCNMGMTGFFEAVPCAKAKHRHAHLSFVATDGSILSYVDVRRFGTWRSMTTPEWPKDRGPDPVKEHALFRHNVVSAVAANPKKFDGVPICQILHDQSIFNGIGNYLRAEILFRAGIPPFAAARGVLANLREVVETNDPVDILTLCRDVPSEVIGLKINKYQGGKQNTHQDATVIGPSGSMAPAGDEQHSAWNKWLRVYGHDDASWAVDKEGRRIWFRGPPGRLCRKFAQKFHLHGTKRQGAGAVDVKKRPAAAVNKKPAVFSGRKKQKQ
eukprot:gnl/TRDRNA2_/TRDRNA2_93106_c0_seq1.p2 gnl/TRDRNA2_/TRDRNA2_93106_c0~~gnl/TRDRNA2_/TRDRNA2_93106_c0_seq1.p2  ORF type:complete len:352 (-),score=51.86 gnl/TRDRNA2_/TRDRNA2_93106_c0_seq1:468-1523(-)